MLKKKARKRSAADTSTLTALLQNETLVRRRETYGTFVWVGVFMAVVAWMTHYMNVGEVDFRVGMLLWFLTMVIIGFATVAHIARRAYRRKSVLIPRTGADAQQGADRPAHRGDKSRKYARPQSRQTRPDSPAAHDAGQRRAPAHGRSHRSRLLYFLNISPNDTGYRDLTELFSRSARQREIDLRLAILKSLEQVGGAKELPVVERLSKGLPTLQSASKVPGEIKKAALECLPYLQARAGEQRASEQLLRASRRSTPPRTMSLLRPAQMRPDAAPEQLLRPTETA